MVAFLLFLLPKLAVEAEQCQPARHRGPPHLGAAAFQVRVVGGV